MDGLSKHKVKKTFKETKIKK